ncbi:ExbD/TolR family protein [Shimia sp.]|uniref:ExbD/TolR family protein n=1 Tax=Shimia sp. TaxID=1954381 RepID=UPI003B8C59F1
MDFASNDRKPRAESIVPMINVVFLLLIFFLMTAQIAPPDPFDVSLPTASEATDTKTDFVLFVGKNDVLQFEDTTGEAVYSALTKHTSESRTVQLRIDATLDGDRLAQVMKKLTAIGMSSVEVVVQSP